MTPNVTSSSMPSQKSGIEYVAIVNDVDRVVGLLTRASTPRRSRSATPKTAESSVETPTSAIVGQARLAISAITGSLRGVRAAEVELRRLPM